VLQSDAPAEDVRKAMADYVLANSDKIRSIARRKLTQATRGVSDSEDVFSSVARRLDGLAADGKLRPRSEAELWKLIKVIARNNAVSQTRLIERSRSLLTEDGPLAYELEKRLKACRSDEEATLLFQRMMLALPDGQHRQLLDLMYRGANHTAIASLLQISVDASRQRWLNIRRTLAKQFVEGAFDD
jgi:DNA-directed RNA polymerase specialized sigma24 family protein